MKTAKTPASATRPGFPLAAHGFVGDGASAHTQPAPAAASAFPAAQPPATAPFPSPSALPRAALSFLLFSLAVILAFLAQAFLAPSVSASASPAPSAAFNADTTFNEVMNVFITWILRVGLLVGFIGAIMFGLAIKNNDSDQKQAGLLTLIAGFVVAAICGAADIFGFFAT